MHQMSRPLPVRSDDNMNLGSTSDLHVFRDVLNDNHDDAIPKCGFV